MQPPSETIVTGTTDSANVTFFSGFSGPTSFGSGNGDIASSGSGDLVGIVGLFGQLSVPDGYVSGAALLSSATWNNATFASLGVTPGTYVWTWGTGYQPELHAHHRRGWGARWRLDSFSARLRFARLGCLAAQIAVAKGEEVMKALPKKLLPLTLFGIAVTSLFSVQPAQAYTVTLQQVGSNVVANGSGAINLTGLTFNPGFVGGVGIQADVAEIITGQPAPAGVDAYTWIHRTDEFREPGTSSRPTLAAETLSALLATSWEQGFFSCHRAMSPVLLYRIA